MSNDFVLRILYFPKHEMLQEIVMGGNAGDAEARQTIKKSSFQLIAAKKGNRSSRYNLQRRSTFSFLEHLRCRERRISFSDHPVMLCCFIRCVVKNVALKRFRPAARNKSN